jgi:large subunit ribosomal protein L6
MSTEVSTRELTVVLPKGATIRAQDGKITAEGPLGSVTRPFPTDVLGFKVAKGEATLTLKIPPNRKAAKALLHTWERHVMNLGAGVTVGFQAKMKVVAAHFPMKVAVKDSTLVIENFLGEKFPRTAPLVPGVKAAVEGEFVVLEGHDIELVGQSAANIERATKIRDYDPRVFQDGIYIIERAHPKGSN